MNNRVYYLDILRIAATFGVLFNHIPLAAVHIFDKQATDVDRFLVNGNVHVMHFAVPLFVMITGALLLQPERKIDYGKVLTKYAWRMVVILALVGTAFAWMEIFFAHKHFALVQIPQVSVYAHRAVSCHAIAEGCGEPPSDKGFGLANSRWTVVYERDSCRNALYRCCGGDKIPCCLALRFPDADGLQAEHNRLPTGPPLAVDGACCRGGVYALWVYGICPWL